MSADPLADPLERIAAALERLADAADPPGDEVEIRIAKIEKLLGNPIPGVTAEQWGKVAKAGRSAIRALRRLT